MKNRGLVVIGTRHWYGNCFCLHHMEPYPTAGHPDEIDLKEAEEFGKEMVEHSRRISAGETDLIPPVPKAPPMTELTENPEGGHVITKFPSMLKFHKEKCLYPSCRLCMDNCPIDGIDLSVKPPVIAKPCMMCEFCTRVCPTGALDMGEWVVPAAKSCEGIYKNLLPKLGKLEAEGKFRRLIPVKDLGIDANGNYIYGYQRHKNHPQWIVGKDGPQ